jgi:hypothetical protein
MTSPTLFDRKLMTLSRQWRGLRRFLTAHVSMWSAEHDIRTVGDRAQRRGPAGPDARPAARRVVNRSGPAGVKVTVTSVPA